MISYEPFFKTIKEKNVSTYTLIHNFGYSNHTIYRLRHNQSVSTALINELCTILNCKVEEIMVFTPPQVTKH